jgi:choline dehydrogenase-like flavoprotein
MLDGRLLVQCSLRLPRSRGQLYLGSANPIAAPLITYGYLDAWDLSRLKEALRLSLELLHQPSVAAAGFRVAVSDGEILSDHWILSNLHTPSHACGTCALGRVSDGAVVDGMCRVHGLDGLRVVDISIAPRSVRAGPGATAVMIGERAADLI